MFALFLLWGLIAATTLAFSKSDDFWKKVFSVEPTLTLKKGTYYGSLALMAIVTVFSFVNFTLGSAFLVIFTMVLWTIFANLIIHLAFKKE